MRATRAIVILFIRSVILEIRLNSTDRGIHGRTLAVRGYEIFENSKVNVGYAFETHTNIFKQLLIIARLSRLS